jgi:MoxR-like ATPase
VEREVQILRARMPDVDATLARQLAMAMSDLRALDLFKPPGVAETLDWAAALKVLSADRLDPTIIDESLGTVLKYREDIERVRDHGLEALVHE